jgi:SAM-dependent methyltransferase
MAAVKLRVADAADMAFRRRDRLTPPRRRNFVGNSDFQATGVEFLGHFRELARLGPSDRVLDVGCGIGRMARVLVGELMPPRGSYDGFDVVRDGIVWCQRHYAATSVPFRFTHVNLYHPEYNPKGSGSAADFRFPYADASFDLAIATSVFTHLLDDVADHYLAEISRVLAPKGRLFSTWFLIDSDRQPDRVHAIASFRHPVGAAWVVDPAAPELAVAYPIPWLRDRLRKHGFRLRDSIYPGSWTGRSGRSSQDIVVAERPG